MADAVLSVSAVIVIQDNRFFSSNLRARHEVTASGHDPQGKQKCHICQQPHFLPLLRLGGMIV